MSLFLRFAFQEISSTAFPEVWTIVTPQPLSSWNIPGNQVSAAVQWINSRTYFLTSGGDYYRFDDNAFAVADGYPRDIATNWQGCTNTLKATQSAIDWGMGDNNGVAGLTPSVIAFIVSLGAMFIYKYWC